VPIRQPARFGNDKLNVTTSWRRTRDIVLAPEDTMTKELDVMCGCVTEAQAILRDHLECGLHSPAETLVRLQRVLSDEGLLRALYTAGYFPGTTPPVSHLHADQGDAVNCSCPIWLRLEFLSEEFPSDPA